MEFLTLSNGIEGKVKTLQYYVEDGEIDDPPSPYEGWGCWQRVRHTAVNGIQWGPFRDLLTGSEIIGDPTDDSQSWTIQFDNLAFDEMLFATTNFEVWGIMTRN